MTFSNNDKKQFRILLVGEGGIGKSTFCKASLLGLNKELKYVKPNFDVKYVPTLGVEVHPLIIGDNTVFNIWDTSG